MKKEEDNNEPQGAAATTLYGLTTVAAAARVARAARGLDPRFFALPPSEVGRGQDYVLAYAAPPAVCRPLPAGAWRELVEAVAQLQRRKLVHRDVGPDKVWLEPASGRYVLGGFQDVLDVRRALRPGAFPAFPHRPGAPELLLLGAVALLPEGGALTEAILREALAPNPAATPFFRYLVGANKSVARRALLKSWKTWDLYALALAVPSSPARFRHPNPAERVPSARAALA